MTTLNFTVGNVNDGPAPFDVIGTDEAGTEIRLRFQDAHPEIQAGDNVTLTYTPNPLPEPEPEVDEADEG